VSNKRHLTDGHGNPVNKWQIRIRSEEPTLIEYSEVKYSFQPPEEDLFILIRRTSYMTERPHREVMWALDLWHPGAEQWVCCMNGKSRLKTGFDTEQFRQEAIRRFPKTRDPHRRRGLN
jgi:hypothetical protein